MTAALLATPGYTIKSMVDNMPAITRERIQDMGLANAELNPKRGRSIASLVVNERCVIIAAGPSIKYADPAKYLHDFDGTILCTDSALRYCLKNDLEPDIIVSVDPHDRIATWLGKPPTDDYFQRQDMDATFKHDEMGELMKGRALNFALGTSVAPSVTERAQNIFWFNPMYDGGEIDAQLRASNGYPSLNCGGNVGSTCWMLAQVLGAKEIALTGMDFSYYAETPYENTQYYKEACELVGKENLEQLYQTFVTAHGMFYTDPAYMWYRQCFLEMVADANCKTFNCTEGGILAGEGITQMRLSEWV